MFKYVYIYVFVYIYLTPSSSDALTHTPRTHTQCYADKQRGIRVDEDRDEAGRTGLFIAIQDDYRCVGAFTLLYRLS